MKKIIFILFLFQAAVNMLNSQSLIIPDVMNNVNVKDSKTGILFTIKADSLPVYTGFPLTLSGSTFEGIVYCNMDTDPEYEIIFNTGYNVNAINTDGTQVPGWPKTVSSFTLEGAPAFGDIDGDGQEEIVVTNHGLTSGGYIYAFKKNGTPVTGFPINHGYSTRTPVLADLNGDNVLEIIVNKRTYPTGSVYIYKGDGTLYPGWPKSIGHVPASSSAVGDINGDGSPEIIAESYNGLYVWKANGDSMPGFPYMMPNGDVNSYSSPVLADMDGDNKREIIFGTHVLGGGGYVYILKNDGTSFSNFPKYVNYWIYGPPAVGFIDNDNLLDIAVGDQVLSGSPANMVYAWNVNGVQLPGFPIGPLNAVNNQIILADIDNDNYTELLFDDNTQTGGKGKYLCYNHDGTVSSLSPIETMGSTFFTTPCVFDANRDGNLDIAGAGTISNPSTTNAYLWNGVVTYNINRLYVPMFQFNPGHNGVYGDILITNIKNNQFTELTMDYYLKQNFPNPFNPTTVIEFKVPLLTSQTSSDNIFVNIKIFDVTGKEIARPVSEILKPGIYSTVFNAEFLTNGIYFYSLILNGKLVETKKAVLVK